MTHQSTKIDGGSRTLIPPARPASAALQILRLPQVCARTGLCRSMIYQLEAEAKDLIAVLRSDWTQLRRPASAGRKSVDFCRYHAARGRELGPLSAFAQIRQGGRQEGRRRFAGIYVQGTAVRERLVEGRVSAEGDIACEVQLSTACE